MTKLNNLKSTIKTMGLFNGLRFLINGKLVKWTDYSLTDSYFHYKSSKYIRCDIKKCRTDFTINIKRKDISSKTCWIYWHQGFENAPEIVKACRRSVEKNLKGYKIILLDKSNLFDHIELPDFIMQKFEKGIIPLTQFSDILRTYLLYAYGGLWLDSTIFLTSDIPQEIKNADYFMFKTTVAIKYYLPCQSWFIAAKEAKNPFIYKMLNCQLKFWHTSNKLKDYFYYFVIIKILIEDDKAFAKSWDSIPYFCDSEPHYLQRQLAKPFDQNVFNHIKSRTFCHKLTYKVPENIRKAKGTFYEHLINRKI